MADLQDEGVRRLLESRNHAVVSTLNADGSIHSTVVWASAQDGKLALNSAVGRKWPSNLERDPRATVVIYDEKNPYDYVEVTGTVSGGTEGADAHIDALAQKYLGVDTYPYRTPDEQRITYLLEPTRVRHQKQG